MGKKGIVRFMKNIKTGVVFPFDEDQVKTKDHMFESDKDGNVLVENQSVKDDDLLVLAESLAEEKKKIQDELREVTKERDEYRKLYGSLESKLPDAPGLEGRKDAVKAAAEPVEEVAPEVEETPESESGMDLSDVETRPEVPKLTKAQIAQELREVHGIEADVRKFKLSDLEDMLDEARIATPEQINEALLG